MATQEHTPIRAPRGELVHATSLASPQKTACGIICRGWAVAPRPLTCQRCKEAVCYPVRRRVVR